MVFTFSKSYSINKANVQFVINSNGSIDVTEFITFNFNGADANEIYSWGHPELNGKIGVIDNQKLVFQVLNVPAN